MILARKKDLETLQEGENKGYISLGKAVVPLAIFAD